MAEVSTDPGNGYPAGPVEGPPAGPRGAGREGGAAGGQRGKRVKIKRGSEVEVVCDSLAFKGLGVCRVPDTGFVVLCERALPGERLVARITKGKQSFAEAYKVRTLAPHADPATPRCDHFGACGGCRLQNLAYSAQLREKEQQVADLMERLGGFGPAYGDGEKEGYLKPIIGCQEEYNYRNKMEFSFGTRVWHPQPPSSQEETDVGGAPEQQPTAALGSSEPSGNGEGGRSKWRENKREKARMEEEMAEGEFRSENDGISDSEDPGGRGGGKQAQPRGFALGLHAPRRFDKILPIERCHLQHETANQVLAHVREYCAAHQDELPAYDPVEHVGFLRHLTLRTGRRPTEDSKEASREASADETALGSFAEARGDGGMVRKEGERGEGEDDGLELMVKFTTKAKKPHLLEPLVKELIARFPAIVSVINEVNTSLSDIAGPSAESIVLHGKQFISVPLRGLVFEVSASSFFQTNVGQAEVLYREVEAACELKGDRSEVVLDLFCGTGSIGLSLAPKVRQVYGYEIVPEAVADAQRNAERNGIQNATFMEGDLGKVLPTAHHATLAESPEPQAHADISRGQSNEAGDSSDLDQSAARDGNAAADGTSPGAVQPLRPDIIITDPNRPGMHPKLLKHLAQVRAPKIVYVSCNPGTCARDISVLCHGEENGQEQGPYRLVSVQPVDMFPHTPHIECVATLVLRESA